MSDRTYSIRAANYADAVVSGEIPSCLYVRRACERFISDLDRDDLVLSDEGDRWCRFLEKLPHTKGKWAGKREKFVLSDWQIFCTVNLYGWLWVASGRRRFREGYICVPRKNGKSFWVAGLGVGHLTIDGEYGAEVYCGAASEKQAWEVFRPAKQIVERTPPLLRRFGIEVYAKSMSVIDNGSRFEPVIGKPGDGSSPSAAIADEFHEHPDSDQVDTFTTGMGARDNPMMLYITTAGADMGGPCYAKQLDVIDILTGVVEDDSVFGIIYTIDDDDDWDTEDALRKANPNFGVSVDEDFLLGQLAKARRSPTAQVAYRTKHLNQWVGAKQAWMNMLAYQRCINKKLAIEQFSGQRCAVGLDLATKSDIASMGIIFPGDTKFGAFCRHYLPEDKVYGEGGIPKYKAWHQAGWLHLTPGNRTDFAYIKADLAELKSRYQIMDVAFDPFQAVQFASELLEDNYPMVEYGQTVKNFSEPMKELDNYIAQQMIEFENDPVLKWMFGNVTAKIDLKENIFPNKEREENKIDGVVALIMALGRILLTPDQYISFPDDYEVPLA